MFPQSRGGSRPKPSPKTNTEILITCLRVFLKILSLATGLSNHKSLGWWWRRMWEHFLTSRWGPGPGMGKQLCWVGPVDTHVWEGDGLFIPRPGRREQNLHCLSGAGPTANAHTWTRLFRGQHDTGGFRSSHTGRAWRAGFWTLSE